MLPSVARDDLTDIPNRLNDRAHALTGGDTVLCMNVGFRLGPFRISTNGQGRTYGGISAGPVSVSGRIGGGRPAPSAVRYLYDSTEDLIAQAEAEGFHVARRYRWATRMERGWRAATIREFREGRRIDPGLSSLAWWWIVSVGVGLLGGLSLIAVIA